MSASSCFASSRSRRRFFRQALALGISGTLLNFMGRAADPKKAAPQNGVSPTEDLMQDHGVLNRVLIVYEEAIRRLHGNGELPPDALRDSAKIVREYVEDYHEMLEQDFLFPRFTNANQMKGLVQILLEQHLGGRNLTDQVLHLAMGPLKAMEDREKLAKILQRFVYMYRAHEAREDTVLLSLIHI